VPKCVPIYNKAAGVINARNRKMGNSKLDIRIGTAPPLENMFLRTLKTHLPEVGEHQTSIHGRV